MSTILAKVLQFGAPVTIISGSSIFTYQKYWPKTIKHWREVYGKSWINEEGNNSDRLYKSVFHDWKSGDKELKIEGLGENTEENDAVAKIKEWCKKTLDVWWNKKLDISFEKFCVYKPETVKSLFIGVGKGQELMNESNDEDYKITFVLFKGTSKYISKIGANSETSVEEGKEKLKTWCKAELDKKISKSPYVGEKFNSIMTLCTKPPKEKKVEDKIKAKNKGWEMIDESNTEAWKAAFKKWKYTREIIDAIKKYDPTDNSDLSEKTEDDAGGPKMKAWCKNGMDKQIIDEGVYKDEYSRLKSACKKTT